MIIPRRHSGTKERRPAKFKSINRARARSNLNGIILPCKIYCRTGLIFISALVRPTHNPFLRWANNLKPAAHAWVGWLVHLSNAKSAVLNKRDDTFSFSTQLQLFCFAFCGLKNSNRVCKITSQSFLLLIGKRG